MKLFCFGFGYVAEYLADDLQKKGWHVKGTSRTLVLPDIFLFDGKSPLTGDSLQALKEATHILISIPPDENGDPVVRLHAADLFDKKWIGYLSTTGVYGDWQGEWVDEDSPLLATEPRSLKRIQAEQAWLALSTSAVIFRLSGIYGPKRNAIEQLLAGKAKRIKKEGQYFSRIHVADIAQVLIASMHLGHQAGRIFNLADQLPAASHDVVAEAARLLDIAPPPLVDFSEAELSPMAASFYSANRRIKAERILRDLHVQLCYPTYKEGLLSLLPSFAEAKNEA